MLDGQTVWWFLLAGLVISLVVASTNGRVTESKEEDEDGVAD